MRRLMVSKRTLFNKRSGASGVSIDAKDDDIKKTYDLSRFSAL